MIFCCESFREQFELFRFMHKKGIGSRKVTTDQDIACGIAEAFECFQAGPKMSRVVPSPGGIVFHRPFDIWGKSGVVFHNHDPGLVIPERFPNVKSVPINVEGEQIKRRRNI